MPDICKCEGTNCPLKEICYRFVAEPSDFMQPFFASTPYDSGKKKCDHYWAIPFCKLTKSNKHE